MTIVIGTTPTIIFNNLQVVRVGEIKEAVLTIKQGGMYSRAVLIKRDLLTAEVSATEIAWTLTQEETLGLDPKAQAQLPDLPTDRDLVMIEFENNTSNNRAGIFWAQVKSPKAKKVVWNGLRVGSQFGGSYGCDVYAGATINVYVGEY